MKKNAKIVNEETKECSVGVGDPKAIYETYQIITGYTEDGEPIYETVTKTVGDWYEEQGMSEMDVEKAYNNLWYLEGYTPEKAAPTKEEISRERELRFEQEADPLRYAYDEALARGEETAEELKQQWLAKKDEIRADLPYPEENE